MFHFSTITVRRGKKPEIASPRIRAGYKAALAPEGGQVMEELLLVEELEERIAPGGYIGAGS